MTGGRTKRELATHLQLKRSAPPDADWTLRVARRFLVISLDSRYGPNSRVNGWHGLTQCRAREPFRPSAIASSASAGIKLAALLGAWLVLFWPTWRTVATLWSEDRQYEHGPLLACVSLLLMFRHPAQFISAPTPNAARILPLLLASIVWWLAYAKHIVSAQQVATVLAGLAMFWAAGGKRGLAAAAVPVGWLVLGMEVWEQAAPLLQLLAVAVARTLVGMIGIPVHVVGAIIEVPAGRFEVVGGCSGIKFMLVASALAVFYGHVHQLALRERAKVLAAAVSLALCANWIRVAAIIAIGQYTDMRSPIVRNHYLFGWVLFAAAFVPMFAFFMRYKRPEPTMRGTDGQRDGPLRWREAAVVVATLAVGPCLGLFGPP